MVNVYSYIAQNNPYTAKQIIESFGYKVTDKSNMGRNLQQLVANEGEEALEAVMNSHPDKDVILELFSPSPQEKKPCGCKEGFANASGIETTTPAKAIEKDFSVLFLAGVLIIALSIQNIK